MEHKQKYLIFSAAVFCIIIVLSAIFTYTYYLKKNKPSVTEVLSSEKKSKKDVQINNKTTITFDNKSDTKLMKDRKKDYGVDKSLDMVVKSDEKVKINGKIIDIEDFEEQKMISTGGFISSDLQNKDLGDITDYGLYVVKKGDNLWDIHFRLLRELFAKEGIKLSKKADKPLDGGYSSGIGKILKFSEKMVSIYSLETDRISNNINMLEPSGKVIIYKMNEIKSLLQDLDEQNINNVTFDGENLWIEN
jgi:biopolymer transport protein ExbD